MNVDEAVSLFGIVKKDNYLAHTIRAIENYAIRNYGLSYHIFTYPSHIVDKTKCEFFDKGCTIRLPYDADKRDDCEIRVRLAHELGHIIWDIEKLKNPEMFEDAGDDEEIFAWEFAYALIALKSNHYKDEQYKNFIFSNEQIGATIQGILCRNNNKYVELELSKKIPFPR